MFHSRRWTPKRIACLACLCLVVYLIFSSRYHKYEISEVIKDTRAQAVWDYVADFSKMRLLNPTILNFRIISQSGNSHNWRYTVQYNERLAHWPYWLNTATADYVVTQSMPDVVPPKYAIQSTHETCFFKGAYCLRAISNFVFKNAGSDTHCVESIEYQCPPFLSGACHRELAYQRKAVMHNLTMIFAKQRHS